MDKVDELLKYLEENKHSKLFSFKEIKFFIENNIPLSLLNKVDVYYDLIQGLSYCHCLYLFDDIVEELDLQNKYVELIEELEKYSMDKNYIKGIIPPDEMRKRVIDSIDYMKSIQRNKKPIKHGYVYIIKSGDKYKIGKTQNMKTRLKKYVTENPEQIEVIHYYECKDYSKEEERLHKKFKKKNYNREWFSLSENDIKYIKKL